MYAGFDYGTSNCAFATMQTGAVTLIPLEGDSCFVPSTLYADDRNLVVEAVYSQINEQSLRTQYAENRERERRHAAAIFRDLALPQGAPYWHMGRKAIENYVNSPGEGWFIKSPKSFLGAAGLSAQHSYFIEDIVTLMMQQVKITAEKNSGEAFEQVVIGRPINFQGVSGEKANQTAVAILTRAAKLAGFKQVEFFYEPLAAGMDFEAQLTEDKTVLILDVGGGTSDCSMVRMGPSYINNSERSSDFLAHKGVRIGGNDLDIGLCYSEFAALLGRNSQLKNGLPVPAQYFSNAVKVNDVNAQALFYSEKYWGELEALIKEAKQPQLLKRLLQIQENRDSFRLTLSAENAKIQLSTHDSHNVDLAYIEEHLSLPLTTKIFEQAVAASIQQITALLTQVVSESNTLPDAVYLTGGSAKSPLIHKAVKACMGEVPIVNGDYFGSVVAGLARWAHVIYR